MNKDFHFNTENINSPPAYEDSYTESAALLADWESFGFIGPECPKTRAPLGRKQPLNLRRETKIQPGQWWLRVTGLRSRGLLVQAPVRTKVFWS